MKTILISLTQPIVELFNPRFPCVLYWRVEKNHLILYPDLMYDRFQGQHSIYGLLIRGDSDSKLISMLAERNGSTCLIVFELLIAPTLVRRFP